MPEQDDNTAENTEEPAEEQAREDEAPEQGGPDGADTADAEEEEAGPDISVERTGATECVIRIEADADYLRSRYQEELEGLQSEVRLAGFRQGRAPLGLVERKMGSTLRSDVISSVVAEAYEKAVDENDLTVVAQVDAPDLENVTWEPGQPAEFEFRCEVLPEIEVTEADYKGLQVEVPALEATDELLRSEMERFAQQFSTWEEITDAGIDWDDYVEADVSVAEAGWQEKMGFYPRSERIGPFTVEGLKGAIVGAQSGAEVEVEGELIEDQIGAREELRDLAGQKLKVSLKIGQVMRRRVPELDDDLARKIGLGSAAEIEPMVRERLAAAVSEQKEQATRQAAVRKLVESVECEMPASLIERAATEEQTRSLVRMLRMGVPRQEAERRAAESIGMARGAVVGRLKAAFLLRKVAEAERIIVTESEVDGQIRAFAARQGWREERARSYMEERGMVRSLRDDIREGRTIDCLLEHAQVKEVPPEELARRAERTDGAGEAAVEE